MEFKDYYQTMGVSRDASQDDIKRAYRRLARKFHPDVSKDSDAESRFKEVGEAYEVLKDPEKRAAYDRFGKDWKAGQEFRPPPNWEREFNFGGGGFTGASEFSDFFESLFGGGAGRARRGPARSKGDDQHARISVRLEEAYAGTTRMLNLRGAGAGANGRGEAGMRERTLNVRIPKGVTEGQRIRLGGQGSTGQGGGPSGDLFLTVDFLPHPMFRVEGRDVYVDLPVAPWEAALGARVEVPTLGGRVNLDVPRGSQTGGKLRLKGRGLPGEPPGDQIAIVEIVTPRADSEEAERLYREMARTMKFNPRAGLGD